MRIKLTGGPFDGQVHQTKVGTRSFWIGGETLPHAAYVNTGQDEPGTGLPLFQYRAPALIKEGAPGPEHEGMRGSLGRWAIEHGFTANIDAKLPNGGEPDVLRTDEVGRSLFIGDAKDSDNETTRTYATYDRIRGYWAEFAALIDADIFDTGTFAIATNRRAEAERWSERLTGFAARFGPSADTMKSPTSGFIEIDRNAWCAYMTYGI